MALSLKIPRKTLLICGIVAVFVVSAVTVFLIAKSISDTKNATREADIAEQVATHRREVLATWTDFANALNSLAIDIYSDGESLSALDGDKIDPYIAKLSALSAPDPALAAPLADYLAAWQELRDNFAAENYEETKSALEKVQNLAIITSDTINSQVDQLISADLAAFEQSIRSNTP